MKKQGGDILGYLTWNSLTQVLAIVPKDALIPSEKDKWLQWSLLGWRIIKGKHFLTNSHLHRNRSAPQASCLQTSVHSFLMLGSLSPKPAFPHTVIP